MPAREFESVQLFFARISAGRIEISQHDVVVFSGIALPSPLNHYLSS